MDAEGISNNDELISQFMAFTSCSDADKAASYLEMSGNNVETAVGLYLEHETGGGGGDGVAAASSGAAAAAPGGGGGGGGGMMMEDDIRAPDATRTMRLMDHDPMMPGVGVGGGGAMGMMMGMMPPGGDAGYHLMNAMMNEELAASSAFAAPAPAAAAADAARARLDAVIAAQGTQRGAARRGSDSMASSSNEGGNGSEEGKDPDHGDDDEDEDDEDYEVEEARPREPANLTDMFSPPTHLMHRAGGFQGARTMAKDSKRWLLVNIQRDSEFASHALNRDVWRDELVENLVREGFIFWQQFDSMPEGQTYTERYQVRDYPHIGIIDPRTGRLLWRKEGWTQQNPLTAASFAEHAMDFCSRNSFDRPPQPPRPGGAAAAAARPPKRSMNEMSESEQLEAAMRASMEDISGGAENDGDAEIQYEDDGGDDEEVEVVEESKPAAEEKPPSLNDELLTFTVPEEPADGSRIQLRMPDGKRAVRRFTPSDPVRTIYAYLAQTMEEARGGREFSLMAGFPPNELIGDIDNTIEASGLKGQAITVRWK